MSNTRGSSYGRLAVGVAALSVLLALVFTFALYEQHGENQSAKTNTAVAHKAPDPGPLAASPADNTVLRDNRLANRVLKSDQFGQHFACEQYPSADNLTTRDLIPTANVVVTIKFDDKSGSYKVADGDDRVAISHSTQDIVSYEGDKPTTSVEDRFTWTTDKGVEAYAWFKEYQATEDTTWGGGELYGDLITDTARPNYDRKLIIANRSAGNSTLRYVIVFTDTTTCKGAGAAPDGMWKDLAKAGLNLPHAARL